MIKRILLVLLLGLIADSAMVFAQTNQAITVSGKVTYQEFPMTGVNIRVVGSSRGTQTDSIGDYSLDARIGETLKFTYVGFKDVDILVEDTSTVLNISLDDFVEELDEVVVTAKGLVSEAPEEDIQLAMKVKLKAPIGIFRPDAHAGVVYYLGPREVKMLSNPDLELALANRYAGVKGPFTWMVDDIEWETPPILAYSDIVQMYIAEVPVSGPTVFIRTVNAPEQIALRKAKQAEKYKNQNFYQDDAVSLGADPLGAPREISGTITFLEAPIADVNISVLGSSRGTKTDRKGRYSIEASPGETLQYSHVSFQKIEILVEDITQRIDLEMITKENELDEVIITVTTPEGDVLSRTQKADRSFQTSRGNFDPKKAGYAVGYVDGDELSNTYSSLKEALQGKISGYSVGINGQAYLRGAGYSVTQDYPVAWEVDGVFTTNEPTYLDLTQIEDVYALKSLAATNKYGTQAAGGVIVVITKFGKFDPSQAKKQADLSKLQNANYYSNDAVVFDGLNGPETPLIKQLKAFRDVEMAFSFYTDELRLATNDYSEKLDIAQLFVSHYRDTQKATKVLEDITKQYASNPEVLKAVAYKYQALGRSREAVAVYKEIARLRPKYGQSIRDLANAHLENNQFVQAWRLYMSYLLSGNKADGEGIGRMIYSEMEYIFYNRNNQAQIKEEFVPINEDLKEFRADIRLVFEWNTSEAEFDIEFVNPERRAYVFEHSLAKNQARITDEKTRGYSSKEFYVNDLEQGEWLVNFTYKGNKKPTPSYIKLSLYQNWGKPEQQQIIRVYKFQEERKKFQLLKLDSTILQTSK